MANEPSFDGNHRLEAEREFHDRQAAERAKSFATGRADLRFIDADYLDHESWIRPAVDALRLTEGQVILDLGCGHGMAATMFARAGAKVYACDLSPGYVAETHARALANGVEIVGNVANAEQLPYSDSTFDAVWGSAVLHHLDLRTAVVEIRRVLKSSGVAVFCEPWGGNPLLNLARRFISTPEGTKHTPDERPLVRTDLDILQEQFPVVVWQGYQLCGMARRIFPSPSVRSILDSVDRELLRNWPAAKNWCRYVVIQLRAD